jgi:RsiW-degrading membrane proteinase PrsW (M82 family)
MGLLSIILYFCILKSAKQSAGSLHEHNIFIQSASSAMLHAAIPEEFIKWIMLTILLIIGHVRKSYHTHYDIIICAVAVSMGFAALENLMFLIDDDNMIRSVLARASGAVPGHCCNAIWMGYFCAIAKFEPSKRWYAIPLCLIVPMLLHFNYDFFIKITNHIDNFWLFWITSLLCEVYNIGVCMLSFKLLKKIKNLYLFNLK